MTEISSKYLNYCIDKQIEVNLELVDGDKLTGKLVGFDEYALVVEVSGVLQLVSAKQIKKVYPSNLIDGRLLKEAILLK